MSRQRTTEEDLHFIQKELQTPVVKVKRKLIEYLFRQFLLHQIAKERGQAGKPDFIAYIDDLSLELPELLPDLLKSFSLKSEAPLQEVLRLANFGYIPPTDPTSLKDDLWWLYAYWHLWPASRMFLSKEAMEGDIGLATGTI